MPTFTPFAGRYSGHIDLALHPGTGVVSITTAFHPDNKGGYNCRLYELAPPWTGLPVLKRDWQQGQNGVLGPFGYGASLSLPNGALLVAVPAGIDGADNVTPNTYIEPNYGPAFPLATGGGADPALTLRVAQLEQTAAAQAAELVELRTMLGNVAAGVLSEADQSLLSWCRALRNVIGMA